MSSEVKVINNPYELLTEDLIRTAVENDLKRKVQLRSFEVKDFTKKGDNYAGIVTSVQVKFDIDGVNERRTYVAKMNPNRNLGPFSCVIESGFLKEAIFLTDIAKELNKELYKINEAPLRIPTCFSKRTDIGKEIYLMTDLRKYALDGELKKFTMFDRKKAMDVPHANLVLEELGRIHASSLLLEHSTGAQFDETFPYFEEPWTNPEHGSYEMLSQMTVSQLTNASKILSAYPKYKKASDWLERKKNSSMEEMKKFFEEKGKFTALSHGDCWNNNILFRYSTENENLPVETSLVDFQMARRITVLMDLEFFLHASLDGETRRSNLPKLLDVYYDSFAKILTKGHITIPFTREELGAEYIAKMFYGCIIGTFILPMVMAEDGEYFEFDNMGSGEKMKKFLGEQQKILESLSVKSNIMEERFLPIFDDLDSHNLMDD